MNLKDRHSLLRRQLKRHFPDAAEIPAAWEPFLQAVDDAYRLFDNDRNMMERSLELSSNELLEANSELRAVFQSLPDLLFRLDEHGVILDFKGGGKTDFFNLPKDLLGKSMFAGPDQQLGQKYRQAVARVKETKAVVTFEHAMTFAGQEHHFEMRLLPMANNQIIAMIRNIDEHTRNEQEKAAQLERIKRQQNAIVQLVTSEALGSGDLDGALRTITEIASEALQIERLGIWLLNEDRTEIRCHDLFQRTAKEHLGGIVQRVTDYPTYFQVLFGSRVIDATDARRDPRTREFTDSYYLPLGITSLLDAAIRVRGSVVGVVCHEHIGAPRRFFSDEIAFAGQIADQAAQVLLAAERKKAEEEKRRLQEQLYQSQKMEAIGRLAGGVAHDFNNILTAIRGFADLVFCSLEEKHPLRKDISQIIHAADTAASLTSQLLAFSRKQIITPRTLNLNEVITGSQKMLRRIIGENIEFLFRPAADLWPVKIDSGQLNQALINLVVNARQAMEDVGKVTLITRNVQVVDRRCQTCPAVFSGDYVAVEVSDTGTGMDEQTVRQIFEPFFTTKPADKGTGLGLATVHGIVHQNNGHLEVVSQIGVGTTFRLYFPRMTAEVTVTVQKAKEKSPAGDETILLVEDQDVVRRLAKRMLIQHGYRVLEAVNGPAALYLSKNYKKKIDLLLTDVIMPKMNGKELYLKLHETMPELDVIYMSGYPEDTIGVHGVLEEGTHFVQKPFQGEQLAAKVREVLDTRKALPVRDQALSS